MRTDAASTHDARAPVSSSTAASTRSLDGPDACARSWGCSATPSPSALAARAAWCTSVAHCATSACRRSGAIAVQLGAGLVSFAEITLIGPVHPFRFRLSITRAARANKVAATQLSNGSDHQQKPPGRCSSRRRQIRRRWPSVCPLQGQAQRSPGWILNRPGTAPLAARFPVADGSAASPSPARHPRSRLPEFAQRSEALCKYILRPPIAQGRVRPLDDGLVRIELKRAFSDGTVAVDLDPLSLLCRLATVVPPPRFHVVRYAGVLASAHKWRSLVVPPRPARRRQRRDPRARARARHGRRAASHPPLPLPALGRAHEAFLRHRCRALLALWRSPQAPRPRHRRSQHRATPPPHRRAVRASRPRTRSRSAVLRQSRSATQARRARRRTERAGGDVRGVSSANRARSAQRERASGEPQDRCTAPGPRRNAPLEPRAGSDVHSERNTLSPARAFQHRLPPIVLPTRRLTRGPSQSRQCDVL